MSEREEMEPGRVPHRRMHNVATELLKLRQRQDRLIEEKEKIQGELVKLSDQFTELTRCLSEGVSKPETTFVVDNAVVQVRKVPTGPAVVTFPEVVRQ